MGLLLNTVWTLVACASVGSWFRFRRSEQTRRSESIAELVMMLVVLFPVISVDDDRCFVQNSAETDSLQFGDHLSTSPNCVFPVMSVPLEPAFDDRGPEFQQLANLENLSRPFVGIHALDLVWGRPPPSA